MKILAIVFVGLAAWKGAAAQEGSRSANGRSGSAVVAAVRAPGPVVVDARDAEPFWRMATAVDNFRVFDPVEDGEPSFRTEARFAYDERNLYVLVRAYDPHPDSIMALLSRRDLNTQSDYVQVVVDSYQDRRTAYWFAVNPVGVKMDAYIYNDVEEDMSWDGVWEAQARIDSLGWIAEFRIPLSQLRFPKRAAHSFGIAVARHIGRNKERSAWPLFRRSRFGIASQLGTLEGLAGLSSARRLEVLPYLVQTNESVVRSGTYGRAQRGSAGADLKFGLSSNLTLDATVNPDFGQVEADPSVLNLSAFEQFFEERRPFFLEGTGIFRFDQDCNDGNCTGLFYSRRIGRSPQLGFRSADPNAVPAATTISGAVKVSGRLDNGLSLGVLNAVTARETVGDTLVVEPRTNYFVARVTKDLRSGRSGLGAMLTAVNREGAGGTELYLRREAYTAGVDARHRFGADNYEVSASIAASLVRGSAEAIAATQRSSVHLYQRPDDDIVYDSTRTALSGASAMLGISKNGGGILRFYSGGWYRSPGFEINDVGFMTSVNNMGWSNWLGLVFQEPRSFYRRLQINFNQWNAFFTDGERTGLGGNVNANVTFRNMWSASGGIGGELPSYCGACLRGGPALYEDPSVFVFAGLRGDSRRALAPALHLSANWRDGGRSRSYTLRPEVSWRVASRFSASLGTSYSSNRDDRQWRGNFGAAGGDTTHYTVAHLEQRTLAFTARANYTVSPTLSLQFYGSPFVSAGRYSDWREVADPRARDYSRRFRPFTLKSDPGSFNFREFRSNLVLRWEYRPGSVLYAVWQQGREASGTEVGEFRGWEDYRTLFAAHPRNTFLVKASYWLGR
jgi:hypothetical protein